jgi:hypothetical protein
MPRVRLCHWRESEATSLIAALRQAGYTVDYPGEKANGIFRSLRETPAPVAVVIDLTRLPSHGRYVAAELRATKSLRHIPIVFVDGDSEKVARIRKDLPDAIYTSRARLAGALKRVKPLADPIAPPRMLQRTDRTTAEKLGIKAGSSVAVVDPPPDYVRVLGPMPRGVELEEDPSTLPVLTLWFVRDADTYMAALPAMRNRTAKTRLWVVYPKQQAKQNARKIAAGLTQSFIREAALTVGLVDYKICSVNEIWTGLLFTRKKV